MDSRPRSLSLTPLTSAVVITLGHTPAGLRLGLLSTIVGSPRSSVQRSLGGLVACGLVVDRGRLPVRYQLADHPARDAVLDAALLLSDPSRSTSLMIRASPAVAYVAAHRRGWVVVVAPDADPAAIDRLRRSVALLDDSRVRAPKVRFADLNELVGLPPDRSRTGSRPREQAPRGQVSTRREAESPVRPRQRTSSG